jgi:hypothetical protein
VTLTSYRCLPEGGRSRPRPDSFTLDAAAGLAASGPLAAVDAYGRPAGRPRWLAGEFLALLERQGRGVGVIYLIHFDRPSATWRIRAGSRPTTPAGRLTCPPGSSTTRPVAAPG